VSYDVIPVPTENIRRYNIPTSVTSLKLVRVINGTQMTNYEPEN